MVNQVIYFCTYNSRLLLTYYHTHVPGSFVTKPPDSTHLRIISGKCNAKSKAQSVKNKSHSAMNDI